MATAYYYTVLIMKNCTVLRFDGGVKHRQDGSARYGRSVIFVRKGCGDDGDKSRDSNDDD